MDEGHILDRVHMGRWMSLGMEMDDLEQIPWDEGIISCPPGEVGTRGQ